MTNHAHGGFDPGHSTRLSALALVGFPGGDAGGVASGFLVCWREREQPTGPREEPPPLWLHLMVNLSGLMDDAKCSAFMRQHRWPEGVRCPACNSFSVALIGFRGGDASIA